MYKRLEPSVVTFKNRYAEGHVYRLLVWEKESPADSYSSWMEIHFTLIEDTEKPDGEYGDRLHNSLKVTREPILGGDGRDLIFLAKGAFFVEPERMRGNHVGTWIFNRTVLWAKQFTNAKVAGIKDIGLAGTNCDELGTVRFHFYSRFGLKVHENGRSWAYSEDMDVSELKEVEVNELDPESCTIERAHEYIRELIKDRDESKAKQALERQQAEFFKDECAKLKAELEAFKSSWWYRIWRLFRSGNNEQV